MWRKETTFEGYLYIDPEETYISKEYEIDQLLEGWIRNYLHDYITGNVASSGDIVMFEDIIPKEVFKEMLKDLKTKFHFKIIVEVEKMG